MSRKMIMIMDFRGTGAITWKGGTYIMVNCDNCGAEYILFDTDPDVPVIHGVCTTCFLPMQVKNHYYFWRRHK
jgi:hypothetical protein